jgi:hypothetical protein
LWEHGGCQYMARKSKTVLNFVFNSLPVVEFVFCD